MKDKLILTIDFGTQSVRSIIFSSKGETLAIEKEAYDQPYFSKGPGLCEQHPSYYFDKLCLTTKRIVENNKDLIDDVVAVSMTCFRDTACILDKDYNVIRPSILWLDQRKAQCKEKFDIIRRLLFFISGMKETVTMNRQRTVANWLKEEEKENFEKTCHYWNISTYFNYLLTGEEKDVPSNYTGHYPIDMKKRKWMSKHSLKYPIFGIDTSLLPTLVEPEEMIGHITKKASELTGLKEGLPFFAAGADKSCESLGVGALHNDMASISYGTASSIQVTNKKYIEPETFLPSYPSPIKNLYNMEVQIYRGYWMLTWFIENFASDIKTEAFIEKNSAEELLNKELLKIPAGSNGLILQPYWGPGLKRPLAKGVIVGFSDYHTKIHLYKSIIEGIAYALREGLEGIEKKQHKKIKEIRLSGGGSKSSAICQITSDIFGVKVSRIQTFETASLGAAILAFVSLGYYKNYDEAIENMVRISSSFTPNKENVKIYNSLFNNIYKHIYPQMKGLNKKISKYSNFKTDEIE